MQCGVVAFKGRMWARISTQVYNDRADFEALAVAVKTLVLQGGWASLDPRAVPGDADDGPTYGTAAILDHYSALRRPTRALGRSRLRACACGMLIGACDSMSCEIHVSSGRASCTGRTDP